MTINDFIADPFERWRCGSYLIAKYDPGYYAYRYFKWSDGTRDAMRLHPQNEPLQSLVDAVALCKLATNTQLSTGGKLIDAPYSPRLTQYHDCA